MCENTTRKTPSVHVSLDSNRRKLRNLVYCSSFKPSLAQIYEPGALKKIGQLVSPGIHNFPEGYPQGKTQEYTTEISPIHCTYYSENSCKGKETSNLLTVRH